MLSPWNALPATYRPSAYVVGGYAVNRQLAQDIDLWLLVETGEEVAEAICEFHDYAAANQFDFTMYDANERLSVYASAAPEGVAIGKLALIEDGRFEKPVQVCLVVGTTEILDALASFDLSVHMFAQGYQGEYYGHDQATFLGAPIRVVSTNTPESSLARLERLAARYGTPVLPEERAKLEAALEVAA